MRAKGLGDKGGGFELDAVALAVVEGQGVADEALAQGVGQAGCGIQSSA